MKRWIRVLLLAAVLHGLLWQFGEVKLLKLGEMASQKLRGRPVNQIQTLDAEGIPVQIYADGSRHYNPLFVASMANREYAKLPDPAALQSFIKLTDWLAEHAETRHSSLLLPYDFDYPKFGMKAPWYSALAQAEAMSAMARRWKQSGDKVWLERSQGFAKSLKPPSDLTLTMYIYTSEEHKPHRQEGLWFMEYPGEQAPYVLNGHMGVLLELWQTHALSSDAELLSLFERGCKGLSDALYRFDKNGFSLYSAEGELAGRAYHQKHIKQLRQLLAIYPNQELQVSLERWQASDRLPVIVQLFYNPRPKRILAFGLSLVAVWLLAWGLGKLIWRR